MNSEISKIIDKLEIWDADDQMDINYVKSSPLYRLLEQIDFEVIEYILFHICLRVIPSWEINCKNTDLRPSIIALNKYLKGLTNSESLFEFKTEIKSPKIDCSYTDTSGASGTIFNSIKSILDKDILYATYAISDAEIANTGGNYEEWIKKDIIPISFLKQIGEKDLIIKGTYPDYKEYYDSLFKLIE